MGFNHSARSRWVRRGAMLIVIVLSLATAGQANADPRPGGPGTSAMPTSPTKRALAGGRPVRITLLTGDTVTYTRDATGRTSATVQPGPGRSSVTFHSRSDERGLYLLPADAEPLVRTGLLDTRLFNLDYLADNGYADNGHADRAGGQLPLIVQYRHRPAVTSLRQQATALPSASAHRPLQSINGVALRVNKGRTGAFWDAIRGTAPAKTSSRTAAAPSPTQLGSGLGKVWLDAKVRAVDDVSNAQIGAAQAWAAGYDGTGVSIGIIDTGVDRTHPDLSDRIVAAQSFIPAELPGGGDPTDVTDRVGHGTHVASIAAGSGAASAGKYTGVGKGAKLMIAKGLDDSGSGPDSVIIEAMQWLAGTQKAKIINMSLGGGPTDGTDPLSQAVNELTAAHGTLFVIAAGNSGPFRGTVASPGTADAALTVGAVDRTDAIAEFSSRGPRLGADFGLKPEMVGPGVGIVAALAAGTSAGQPVGDKYTALSGTSMATPHVAGAAAVLLQRYPQWTAGQLKAALVGTARDVGVNGYIQGAGRLDLGRAATQQVFADTATVSGGFSFPYDQPTRRQTVTYRNTGTALVTLALSLPVTRRDGAPAGAGLVGVDKTSVTVPAGGQASATLSIDPRAGDPGLYTGRLLAVGGAGEQVSVAIGFYKQPRQRTLKVRVVGGAREIVPTLPVTATRLNDTSPALDGEPNVVSVGDFVPTGEPNTYEVTMRLADGGVYMIDTQLRWTDPTDGVLNWALLSKPELHLDADTTLTLDTGKLARIEVRTPRASDQVGMNLSASRTTASGQEWFSGGIFSYPAVAPGAFWLLPTERTAPRIGAYTVWFDQINVTPQVTLSLTGQRTVDLRPRYVSEFHSTVPKFSADRRLDVVSEAELRAGTEVRDTLVFGQPRTHEALLELMDLAHKGGAAGVLTDSRFAWLIEFYPDYHRIPLLWVDQAGGEAVRRMLADGGRTRANLDADLSGSYEYKLAYYLHGHVPDRLVFRPTDRDLRAIQAVYHAQYPPAAGQWGDGPNSSEANHTYAAKQRISIKAGHSFVAPSRRTEYFNVTGRDVLWWRTYTFGVPPFDTMDRVPSVFSTFESAGGDEVREDWNELVLPAQNAANSMVETTYGVTHPCDGCRQGDTARIRSLGAFGIGEYTGAADAAHSYRGEPGAEEEVHLYAGNAELQPSYDELGLPYYQLPAQHAKYRATSTFRSGFAGKHTGTTVSTTWNFTSGRPAVNSVNAPYTCIDSVLFGDTRACGWLPLIFPHYRFNLDPDDTTPGGEVFRFTVTGQRHDNPAARLADLRVWISADGGRTWKEAKVDRGAGNAYRVTVKNPTKSEASTGTVAVRVAGGDYAGNTVHQVILDAYRLR